MILLPNGTIASMAPQRQWKCLEVTELKTGKKILIKDFGYDPKIHSDPREVPKPQLGSVKFAPIVIESKPEVKPETKPGEKKEELLNVIVTPQERLGFLKSKGWKNLDKHERANYTELKARFEPKVKEVNGNN
jgi:hypothetical protein